MKKTPFKNIGFIGLGLIGGSIAKAIHTFFPDIEMYADDRDKQTVQDACDEGVLSDPAPLTPGQYGKMDVIFLCAPVRANISWLKEHGNTLGKNTIITDVGSVKSDILETADNLTLSAPFIGGHPMTGSENSGFSSANAELLENAFYILSRGKNVSDDTFDTFSNFIDALGAIVLPLDPRIHDYSTAAISHLPHIVAASLVNLVDDNDTEAHSMAKIAAGGFKDVTRIASSSPVMWRDICLQNRGPILHLISLYTKSLKQIYDIIDRQDGIEIEAMFSKAKDFRDSLPITRHSLLPQTFDIYLDLKDEAGQIRNVAVILADEDISLKNIGIIHNREFEQGVLRISLYDNASKESAENLLQQNGYHIYRR